MPLLWLNATLLYVALASVALAASVSFDRLAPALGVALGFTVVSYFLEVLGSLWDRGEAAPAVVGLPLPRSAGGADRRPGPTDIVVLGIVVPAGVAWSLVVFPRRDLAGAKLGEERRWTPGASTSCGPRASRPTCATTSSCACRP